MESSALSELSASSSLLFAASGMTWVTSARVNKIEIMRSHSSRAVISICSSIVYADDYSGTTRLTRVQCNLLYSPTHRVQLVSISSTARREEVLASYECANEPSSRQQTNIQWVSEHHCAIGARSNSVGALSWQVPIDTDASTERCGHERCRPPRCTGLSRSESPW